MLIIDYKNFKCEGCDCDKFTVIDDFSFGNDDFTIHCAGKDCEASYTFRPKMELSSSSLPSKRCPCGVDFLSQTDFYCSHCGRKNPYFIKWRKENLSGMKKKGKVKNDNKQKKKV